MSDLADSEILDRINKIGLNVASLETKVDTLLEARALCREHSDRLRSIEETVAADKRMRGVIYAALCLGIPAITSVVVVFITKFA